MQLLEEPVSSSLQGGCGVAEDKRNVPEPHFKEKGRSVTQMQKAIYFDELAQFFSADTDWFWEDTKILFPFLCRS